MTISGIGELEYTVYVEQSLRRFIDGGLESGRKAIAPLANIPWEGLSAGPSLGIEKSVVDKQRPSNNKTQAVATYARDCYHCRYCWRRVVPLPVLTLLHDLYPDELPYVSSYRKDTIHPAFWRIVAEHDHIDPGSRSGDWDSPDNFATACVVCNTRKSNHRLEELGWSLKPIPTSNWDGLVPLFITAWNAADKPKNQTSWAKVLSPT